MTDPRDLDPLEQLVAREFARLPAPKAPRTLLPRVMTAVGVEQARPWYARPWVTWSPALQMLSVVFVAMAAAGAWLLWPEVAPALQRAGQVSAVVRALWNVLLGPIAIVLFILTIVVVLACAAAWTAVSRVTLGGASSQ